MNKIGTIYEQIANTCLIERYPDMSDIEIETLLERGDLEEIESYIGAKNFIDVAIADIRESLARRYQIFLPVNFSDIVYFSDTPNDEVEHLTFEIGKRHIDDLEMSSIAFHALSKIHKRWIHDNEEKFFDPNRRDRRFMFLPIELIGWEEALKYYVFLRPILQLLCIRPETYHIQKYYESVRNFFKSRFSPDMDIDADVTAITIYGSLVHTDKNITDAEVREVIKQVIFHCPDLSAE